MALIRRRASAPRREPRAEDFEVARDDRFVVLEDEAPLPAEGDVLVSLARFERERETLRHHRGRVGVHAPPDAPPERVGAVASEVPLLALHFPTHRDGRAYSLAHWLRARFGFAGELRAVGKVVRDQLAYLARVGFDSFELSRGSAEDALASFDELSVHYQAAADHRLPLWKRAQRG